MQYSALLVLAATATSVTAIMGQDAIPLPRGAMALAARQTATDDASQPTDTSSSGDDDDDGDDDSTCDSEASTVLANMPTGAADLDNYFATYSVTASCVAVPTSVASELDDWASSLDAWYSSSSSEIDSFLQECTDYASVFYLMSELCTEVADDVSSGVASATAAATGSDSSATGATTTSTGTGSATAKTSSASGTKTTASGTVTATAGAAVREVGIVGALLAGALGVAVAL